MNVVQRKFAVALCLAALGSAACGGGSTSTPTGPSTPPTTETFTGTVGIGGLVSHPFTVALSNGLVTITLTQAGPPATIFMGLGVGAPSGDTCALFSGGSVATQAGTTAQLSGTAAAGPYCVAVFDVGNQTADVAYTVTVTHY